MKTRVIQNEPEEPVRDVPTTRGGIRSLVRRHRLVTFFVLSYVLAWWAVPFGGPFLPAGPLLAALIVIAMAEGRVGFRQLGSRMIRWRVGWHWYAIALGIPLGVYVVAIGMNVALGAPGLSWATIPSLTSFILVFGGRLIDPLEGGLGEEPGWRGYALPRLQAGRSPLLATLILGLVVAGWHVPLLLPEYGLPPVGLLATVAVTFWFTWLFNRTGGSVLLTLVAHAAEGTIQPDELWAAGAAVTRVDWLAPLVWCGVAIALIVFDGKFWRRPAPPSAMAVPPASRRAPPSPAQSTATSAG